MGYAQGTDLASLQALIRRAEDQKPATPIARAAEEICRKACPPWLRAHCYRTYAIGVLLGSRLSFDSEKFFVVSMLHDVGLTDAFRQGSDTGLVSGYARKDEPCFAVRGARVAQALATIHELPPGRSDVLAQAVSLHLNVRVTRSQGVEAHLLNAASALDVIRLKSHKVPNEAIRSIEDRWPRDDSFCKDLWMAWKRESDDHGECRGAFLNTWGFFKRRIHRTCPPN